jgi:hypothetical protein
MGAIDIFTVIETRPLWQKMVGRGKEMSLKNKSGQTNRRIRRTVPILEDLGVQEKALVQDDGLDKVTVANDDQAKKDFYARALQEWAEGLKRQHRKFLMPSRPFLRAITSGGER